MFRTSSVHYQERFLQAVLAELVCGNMRITQHVHVSSTNHFKTNLRLTELDSYTCSTMQRLQPVSPQSTVPVTLPSP